MILYIYNIYIYIYIIVERYRCAIGESVADRKIDREIDR